MGIGIVDNSADLLGLGVNSNKEARVNLSQTSVTAGYATMLSESDPGAIMGTRQVKTPEASPDFRMRVGQDSLLFNAWFPGITFDSSVWTVVLSNMTANQNAGVLTLNAGSSTTTAHVARLQTYRSFPIYGAFGMYCEMLVQFTQVPQVNNVCEWGAFQSSGTTAPLDGCFFRLGADGTFKAVVNRNGVENESSDLTSLITPGVNTVKHYVITVTEDWVTFWIDDVMVSRVIRPAGQFSNCITGQLPVAFRTYNQGIPAIAQQMKISMAQVALIDANRAKPWNDVMAGMGGSAYQGQIGNTMGSITVYGNSTYPGVGTATNTTAGLGSGLGGFFHSRLDVLTSNVDYIIQSYQVPVGGTNIPAKTLYVNAVGIDTMNFTAQSGGTAPVNWLTGVAFGHNTVSLASAESVTTKSPRRIPLNVYTMPGTSPVGTPAICQNSWKTFNTPIVVQPGEFIQVTQRFIGTLHTTASQTQMHQVSFDGYFE